MYVECFVLFSKYFVLVFKMNDNFTLHISNSNGNFKQFNLDLGFINKWEQQSKLHLLSNISSLDSCHPFSDLVESLSQAEPEKK